MVYCTMEVLFWLLRNWFTCICTGWAYCTPPSCKLWQLWSGEDARVSFCRCQQQHQCEYHQYTHSTHAWLVSVGRSIIHPGNLRLICTYRSKRQVILATTLKRLSCWACGVENNWCLHRNTSWRPLLRNTHPPYMQQGCVQWGGRVYGINFDIPFSVQRTPEVINIISHLPGGSLFWFPGRSHLTLWSLAVCKYGYYKWSKTEGGNVLGTRLVAALLVLLWASRSLVNSTLHPHIVWCQWKLKLPVFLLGTLEVTLPLLGGMLCSLVTSPWGVVYQVDSLHRSLITTVSCPDPKISRGKGSSGYWVISWLCRASSLDFWRANGSSRHSCKWSCNHATNGLFKSILQLGTTNKLLNSNQTLFSCEDGVWAQDCVPFRLLLRPHRSEVNVSLLSTTWSTWLVQLWTADVYIVTTLRSTI